MRHLPSGMPTISKVKRSIRPPATITPPLVFRHHMKRSIHQISTVLSSVLSTIRNIAARNVIPRPPDQHRRQCHKNRTINPAAQSRPTMRVQLAFSSLVSQAVVIRSGPHMRIFILRPHISVGNSYGITCDPDKDTSLAQQFVGAAMCNFRRQCSDPFVPNKDISSIRTRGHHTSEHRYGQPFHQIEAFTSVHQTSRRPKHILVTSDRTRQNIIITKRSSEHQRRTTRSHVLSRERFVAYLVSSRRPVATIGRVKTKRRASSAKANRNRYA